MRLREPPVPASAPKRPAAVHRGPGARAPGQSRAARIAGHLAAIQLRKTDADSAQRREAEPAPRRNETGLPGRLKAGVEALSGFSMDDVRVHYGSAKPAQMQAYAYTQGAEIHVAPGQERHLAHEAWHVVQQKQGRVRPTIQFFGVPVNEDSALEREADRFGSLADAWSGPSAGAVQRKLAAAPVVQRASVTASGYTVSLTADFTKNHLRSSKLSANSRSSKRRLNRSTIINDKNADVKATVEGSELGNWNQSGSDPHFYQSFNLAHWLTTYHANAPNYRTTDELTSAVRLGAYFDSAKSTSKVTHLSS